MALSCRGGNFGPARWCFCRIDNRVSNFILSKRSTANHILLV
jgi:hypothetical protein